MRTRLLVLISLASLGACGDDDDDGGPVDLGADMSAGLCQTDEDCDDGVFCNGVETCVRGGLGRDERDCVPGESPCAATDTCNEAAMECNPCVDADGDGACAMNDCDDSDPRRANGFTEVCDDGDVDEDCNPDTFGERDEDGDGFIDAECCNAQASGDLLCGDDCDDSNERVFAFAGEICDGINNDCDDNVDEGVGGEVYEDLDGDGFGAGSPVLACSATAGFAENGTDCDDSDAAINPGNAERCDAAERDEDCDGVANEDCDCSGGEVRSCALPGACSAGTQACSTAGTWGGCSLAPTVESCDGVDDDCDGLTDEGLTVSCYVDDDGDGWALSGTAEVAACPVASRPAVGGCPVGFTDRAPVPLPDCDDSDPAINPGVESEVCGNLRDDDCNLQVDDGCD